MTDRHNPPYDVPTSDDPADLFRGLADIVYRADDFAGIYHYICALAPLLVVGCDHASLMLRQNARIATGAATDDTARRIDELERELGEGPCLDAITEEEAFLDPDLLDGSPWPRLTERVLDETTVRGMAGFRVVIDDRKVAALNLFSDTPGKLCGQSTDQAAVLAAFASVALMAASSQEAASTLRGGLDSNREIGKAVGLLMAFHEIDDAEAFAMLQKSSQDMNLKVSQIAGEIVRHHNDRPS